ncbi:MAG: DNA recombination protein RmuC [Paludibacter sp.]|nr:DNA recombination protein RmuC [Paludibacter sp.]
MNLFYILIGIIVGGFLAWVITFLFMKNKTFSKKEKTELEQKITDFTVNLSAANAMLNAEKQIVAGREAEIDVLKNDFKNQTADLIKEKEKTSQLAALNNSFEEKFETQKAEIEALRKQFNTEFENIANKILEEKTQKFTSLNEEKMLGILAPLKERIQNFERKVEETYSNETREKASLRKELEQIININRQMSDDAQRLTLALKGDKKLQGDWGEMQLEQLLEKSGLLRGVHYLKQENFKTDDFTDLRPDYVINLPENKHYIIDSKVSLVNYEQFFNAENDDEKNIFLSKLIKDIDNHIDFLSRKKYQDLTNSPDFVFMYFALETALFAALQNDLTLFDRALKKNIVLVSNTTLLASLRTVSFIWKQENQKNNVLEIAKIGGQLYDKFVSFADNMIKVGQTMDSAKKTYSEAMNQLVKQNANGSFNAGTIVGMTENLKKLGANATKSLQQTLIDRVENEEN